MFRKCSCVRAAAAPGACGGAKAGLDTSVCQLKKITISVIMAKVWEGSRFYVFCKSTVNRCVESVLFDFIFAL